MTAPNLLEVRGLSSGHGSIPVLRNIDLDIRTGEVVGIQGYNGMGKTTLILAIMGLLPLTSGSVRFDGEELARLPAHQRSRRGIAIVPQGRLIMSSLSVADNMRFAYVDCGDESEDEMLLRLGGIFPTLEGLLNRKGGSLSGGQQQLLAIARALAARPRLLLLDEPTEGIQPTIVAEIVGLISRLSGTGGLSVLVTEQDHNFARKICDCVYTIVRGELTPGAFGEFAQAPPVPPAKIERASAAQPVQSPVGPPPTQDRRGKSKQHIRTNTASNGGSITTKDLGMAVKRPSLEQLRQVALSLNMNMSDNELLEYRECMEGTLHAYDRVEEMADNVPAVRYPRTPGHQPDPQDNLLNAWYVKAEVNGAPDGPLAGREIVLKDNICLAGVQMMNGSATLEGYVPDVDATVVQRILDAGGKIVGKAVCEHFCFSGGSHTSDNGPVHNPYRRGYTSGGSSSGCGALVGANEVDLTIGGDQGGSVRIPSSWCGCCGMKPTHGLVPYTGAFPIEATIDHLGPITATVADNALLLEVIAGPDGLDQRQNAPQTHSYTNAIGAGVSGLRIGVLEEGFGWPSMEPDVAQKVRTASESLRELGATVADVSLPEHLDAAAVWTPIALEGMVSMMMESNAHANNRRGLFITSMLERHSSSWRAKADSLSPSLKVSMLIGKHFQLQNGGRYYGKAQNIARRLRQAYDDMFKQVDLLLMPTLPMKAPPHPPPDAPLSLYIQRSFEMVPNTAPFNLTGHPAMSVPCGLSEGLPVGMMLVGRYWDELTIYRAAHSFEQLGEWKRM